MPMDTPTIPNLPIRDLGSFANAHVPSDADIKGNLKHLIVDSFISVVTNFLGFGKDCIHSFRKICNLLNIYICGSLAPMKSTKIGIQRNQ